MNGLHSTGAMRDGPGESGDGPAWTQGDVPGIAGRPLPEPGMPTGYAALIDHFGLQTPLPPRLAAVAPRYHPASTSEWLMLTPRHRPAPTRAGHLAGDFTTLTMDKALHTMSISQDHFGARP